MSSKKELPVVKSAKHYLKLLGSELEGRGTKPELQLKSLPYVSDRLWGLAPRELMVIAARPSQGKSAFAMQLAFDLASQGIPSMFLSLEMSVLAMLERLFCHYTNIQNTSILRGGFKDYPAQWKAFCEHVNQTPLLITEGLGKTWDEIDMVIDQMDTKPRVIILDYIGMVDSDGEEKRNAIERWIKNFRRKAIEYNFAGIVCAQINREGDVKGQKNAGDHLPSLRHIKETGCLEEHCDSALLLHYPRHYSVEEDQNKFTLILAKKRNGPTGIINCRFIPQYYKFEDDGHKPAIDENVATAMEVFGGQPFELTRNPDGTMPVLRRNVQAV